MSKYSGSGWHFQSVRHSNARKYGHAGGKYALSIKEAWRYPFLIHTVKVNSKKYMKKTKKYDPEKVEDLMELWRKKGLIDDRREYDKEDLAKAYPELTKMEVDELYFRLQHYNAFSNKEMKTYVTEYIDDDAEMGDALWSNSPQVKQALNKFYKDVAKERGGKTINKLKRIAKKYKGTEKEIVDDLILYIEQSSDLI
jgi:hypothetical protein